MENCLDARSYPDVMYDSIASKEVKDDFYEEEEIEDEMGNYRPNMTTAIFLSGFVTVPLLAACAITYATHEVINRVCDNHEENDEIKKKANSSFSDASKIFVGNMAKEMIGIVLRTESLRPEEREAFLLIDPEKVSTILSKLINLEEINPSFEDIKYMTPTEWESLITDEQKKDITALISLVLDQIVPFQNGSENGGYLIKRAISVDNKGDISSSDFQELRDIFNEKAIETFSQIGVDVHILDLMDNVMLPNFQ